MMMMETATADDGHNYNKHEDNDDNGKRHNGKYVHVSTGILFYSIRIKFFSQNQSLKKMIIMTTMTTTTNTANVPK